MTVRRFRRGEPISQHPAGISAGGSLNEMDIIFAMRRTLATRWTEWLHDQQAALATATMGEELWLAGGELEVRRGERDDSQVIAAWS